MCGPRSIRSCGRTPKWKCCRELYDVGYGGANAWGKTRQDEGGRRVERAFRPVSQPFFSRVISELLHPPRVEHAFRRALRLLVLSPALATEVTHSRAFTSGAKAHSLATTSDVRLKAYSTLPALKRWAKIFRPYGARLTVVRSLYDTPKLVHARTAIRHAKLFPAYAALILLLVLPSAAQVTVGDNLNLNLNGVVSVGYDDTYGSDISSSHSVDFGGNGTLSGSYYNPNFLNFTLSPYYNQSSANSESRSIFNTSGFEFDSNIFGGSHFPGSIGFSKSWNSEGNFGVPGVPNYTTRGDGQGFSIGWGAFLQGLPSLSATFNSGSGEYSVLGANQNGSNDFHNFNVRSNYTIAGFNLNAAYNIGNSHSDIPAVFGNQAETVNTDNNSFLFGASHSLPMHGSAAVSFVRSYVNFDYLGYNFNGTIDTVNASAGINPTQKLSFSVAMGYTDNLVGSFYQSILPAGGSASQGTTGVQSQAQSSGTSAQQQQTGGVFQQSEQSSSALYFSGFGNYAVANNLQLQFQVQRRQQDYLGKSYGADTYGAGAVYTRGFLGGFLNASVNFADNTSDTISGNALSFTTNVSYSRTFSDWFVSGSAAYAQNVASYLVTYLNSYYLYSGNVRHRFGRIVWTAAAAASHSAIVDQPHTGNGSQSYSTSLGARRLTLSAAYAKSNGYGLLSGNGITLPPGLPPGVIPPEWLLFYGGSSYSFGLGTSPIRHMTIGASFSRADSNTVSGLTFSANHTEQVNANGNYVFRKLTFTAGYGRLVQGFSATGLPASNVNSIYFGVSRYFNFF
jgi:hypothetical protein